jgi:hypothetical protein
VTSCAILPKPPVSPWSDSGQTSSEDSEDRAKETEKTKDQVEKARDDVHSIHGKVLEHTGKIKGKDPKGELKPEVSGIEGEMVRQAKVKEELDTVVDDLNQHKGALIVDRQKIESLEATIVAKDEQLETQRSAYEEMIEDLKKKLEVSNSKYMRVLIILSVVLMAISGMMFFHKPSKESLSVGVGGAVLLVVSLAVQHYSEKFALVGFGAIAIAIGIIAWKVFEQTKTIKAKDEVEEDFEEVVETVELAKEKLPEPEKTELFGSLNSDGKTGTIQSKRTKKRVLDARKKVNDKNKPTMEG